MKKALFSVLLMTVVLTSCNQKKNEDTIHNSNMMHKDTMMTAHDSTMMHNSTTSSKMYSCPMHPEVQGKMNDNCNKCGMKLTEPVK